jgi:hypothetical protein
MEMAKLRNRLSEGLLLPQLRVEAPSEDGEVQQVQVDGDRAIFDTAE